MAIISVEIPNLQELIFNLKRYPAISEKWLQKAIMASAAELYKARRQVGIPWRTGHLTMRWGTAIGRLFARVWPTVKYAPYVYFGTRPHIIEPRIKKALYWEGAPHPVRRVMHPGTKENRFLDRMVKLAEPKIAEHFKKAGDNILKEIAVK
jgi:hypothetical protein